MLPPETIEAIFPSTVAVGHALTLRPLTAGKVALLSVMGVDATDPPGDAPHVLLLAWVLSMDGAEVVATANDPDRAGRFRAWCEKHNPDGVRLREAVARILVEAFHTYVPPKQENGNSIYATPTGYGWPLELAECIAHEYGYRFEEAMDVPLSRVYAMLNCARQRNGGQAGGPTYAERPFVEEATRQLREMKNRAQDSKRDREE